MEQYAYLIIGGGMAADAAARGIREIDEQGSIGILSSDRDEPYARPPLSKLLWLNPDTKFEDFFLGTAQDTGATLRTDTTVESIDRNERTVALADGERIGYQKLLLATGAEPRRLDGARSERIIPFRTAQDYRTLRGFTTTQKDFVVVGGGYIGAELAAVLSQEGVNVQIVTPETMMGESKFPADLSVRYQKLFEDAGVVVHNGRRAQEVQEKGDRLTVLLDDGQELQSDVVAVGLGAEPRTDLAAQAGLVLAEDGGVEVDQDLRTSDPQIWAAGDIASYPDVILGRTRVEHVDNATHMGTTAGRSMASDGEAYGHTPYFYSLVLGTRWEAVGALDSSMETLEVPLDEERTVVYYLAEDRKPAGVLLWKVEDARDAAREVIANPPADPEELRTRIQ